MADKGPVHHAKEEDDVVEIKKAMATGSGSSSTFVVSGTHFNMNFLLLCMQSSVCVACVFTVKRLGIISFRDFDMKDAKVWWPISVMLVGVIYTGSKSLQYLSIPVYTIFKNLTIILIAYGEVIWFGGRVTGLTLVSFILMVASSIIAAWADISDALAIGDPAVAEAAYGLASVTGVVSKMNIGYFWMFLNCATSAAYVLTMRKRIKLTGFSDWDTMFYNNLLSIPVLAVASIVAENWGYENLVRNFMVGALNKLPVAASGMIFFGDRVTFGSVTAVSVGFFAGLVYAVAKNNQKKAETASQQSVIPLANRTS
ncbi:GDP-mannose transporter [Trametes pubescens]|uniref:GDP-mannose transporter n=1 Tax=Trametes pubescens TaxID=154538 RepID=A0A1M2VQE1_TRAPU|nr:GDP-mannose transporter [Trametes pubescens]